MSIRVHGVDITKSSTLNGKALDAASGRSRLQFLHNKIIALQGDSQSTLGDRDQPLTPRSQREFCQLTGLFSEDSSTLYTEVKITRAEASSESVCTLLGLRHIIHPEESYVIHFYPSICRRCDNISLMASLLTRCNFASSMDILRAYERPSQEMEWYKEALRSRFEAAWNDAFLSSTKYFHMSFLHFIGCECLMQEELRSFDREIFCQLTLFITHVHQAQRALNDHVRKAVFDHGKQILSALNQLKASLQRRKLELSIVPTELEKINNMALSLSQNSLNVCTRIDLWIEDFFQESDIMRERTSDFMRQRISNAPSHQVNHLLFAWESVKEKLSGLREAIRFSFDMIKDRVKMNFIIHQEENALRYIELLYRKLLQLHALCLQSYKYSATLAIVEKEEQSMHQSIILRNGEEFAAITSVIDWTSNPSVAVVTIPSNELLLTALEEALLTISDESDFSFLMDDGKLHFF